ncbi:MAG: PASTA domain-containing protein [Chloroflexi bacterium]|nr:PASTA domain-containing protein [Chloroflexota bacterium]
MAALAALFLASSALTTSVQAAAEPPSAPPPQGSISDATDGTGSNCTGQPAYKAVIVVGPVGSMTTKFKQWADQIAASAKDAGMKVCKVYTPNADAATVKKAAKGADLFVTLMHGNGYPKPNRTKQDGTGTSAPETASAHGLGLNASKGSSTNKYYGADWVRQNIQLAPNAVVILSHMCFTAGNSEDYDRIPTYELAIDHVDNFAQGFLGTTSVGGGRPSVVMALQSQSFDKADPKGTLIKTLMTSNKTMDQTFMTTYSRNTGAAWKDAYLPNFGAIGTTDFYVTRRSDGSDLRSPGRIHMDPDLFARNATPSLPSSWDPNEPNITWLNKFAGKTKNIANPNGSGVVRFGYVRAITGDLGLTAAEWRESAGDGAPPPTPTPSDPPSTPAPAAQVAIPNVKGLTLAQAKQAIKDAGLKVKSPEKTVTHATVKVGRAVNTTPTWKVDGEPRKVAKGTAIQIKISSGPDGSTPSPSPSPSAPPSSPAPAGNVAIPKIAGMTKAQAKAAIEAAGLKVKTPDLKVESTKWVKGKAVNTYPSFKNADGTPRKVKKGSTVQLKLSSGPGPASAAGGSSTTTGKVAIPKVRGLSKAKAIAAIEAAGLKVQSTKKVSNGAVASGKAVNTTPSYQNSDGSPRKVAKGTAVQLKLSTGP